MIFEGSVNNNFLGIYIHIPFCIKKCNYCDFCSFPDSEENLIDAYVNELIRRINNFYAQHGKRKVDTVYFGGGTPTLMSGKQFERILNALRNSFDISDGAEITAECNPASIDLNGLSKLHELGINRLSIGLQSADNKELKMLGRIHTWEVFAETWDLVREIGFTNVNIDLMSALPGQALESYEKHYEKLLP